MGVKLLEFVEDVCRVLYAQLSSYLLEGMGAIGTHESQSMAARVPLFVLTLVADLLKQYDRTVQSSKMPSKSSLGLKIISNTLFGSGDPRPVAKGFRTIARSQRGYKGGCW